MSEKEGGAPDHVLPPSFLIINQKSGVLLCDTVFLSAWLPVINGITGGQSPPSSLCRQSAFGSFSLFLRPKRKKTNKRLVFKIKAEKLFMCRSRIKFGMTLYVKGVRGQSP